MAMRPGDVPVPTTRRDASPGAAPTVRRAVATDVEAMADQLAATFFDDPVAAHIFRDARRRPAALRRFFGTQMRADYLRFGGCYTTSDHSGAAIWAPAGKPYLSGVAGMVALAPVLPFAIRHLVVTLKLLALIEAKHPKEPHWYLATLGTDPARQGQGIGSSLMAPVLAHCDREGLPAYLESSKERNVPFYARHGFEVKETVELPGSGPTIWTMWRTPRPPEH